MAGERANNLEDLKLILSRMYTTKGVAAGLAFKPQPTDVIISPFGKCGTTWMQQIVHGLRTRGSMDFGEISEVVPWIEAASDIQQDLNAAQVAIPRTYKSHLSWDRVPQGGRYICVVRDPVRAMLSSYMFFEGWLMEPGTISFEDFAFNFYLARSAPAGYWHHLNSWVEQRDNPDVLLLCYEHLQQDLPGNLPKIASFLKIGLDSALEDCVLYQSSLEFMQQHSTQFDDHFLADKRGKAPGVPAGGASSKISSADALKHRPQPNDAVLKAMENRWTEDVTPKTGFDNYQQLLASFS